MILSLGFKSPNFRKGHFRPAWLLLAFLSAVATGALGAWLFSFVASRFHPVTVGDLKYASIGVPLVFMTLACVGVFSVGVSSKITEDDDREWWSRAGAWVLAVGIAWLLFSSLVLLLPAQIQDLPPGWSLSFSTASAVLGWFVSRAGASDKSGGASRGDQSAKQASSVTTKLNTLLLPAAAILFLIALACAITFLNGWLTGFVPGGRPVLILAELGLAILMSYAVNVNKFSLHAMYRMRLVRAYLGASNTEQKPNPFYRI